MATWLWHRFCRTVEDPELREEFATTEGMTPPDGWGWVLVPGQVPGGRVEGGTGNTRMHAKPPRTRVGEYDANGVGRASKVEVLPDDGRPLRNTTTHRGTRPA